MIKPTLKRVIYIGAVVNLLTLATTLYMMEVYDWTGPAFIDIFRLPVRSCSNASELTVQCLSAVAPRL